MAPSAYGWQGISGTNEASQERGQLRCAPDGILMLMARFSDVMDGVAGTL